MIPNRRESAANDAPLVPGAHLGPYKIENMLGEGGMGEVWKAHDTRLRRTVAIKISRAQFSNRFQREARAVAALNHSHIAAIYDIGAGPSGGYLVLEYVEGLTLAELIQKGPVPLAQALKIALQVADAMEAAHDKGIIHRDLKPANIKLTPEGSVKVLDFGLARAMDEAGLSVASDARTQINALLGTPAYMAPEQALGQPADRRADIWSFGVVVYEMLTGERPFIGGSPQELLAAVIQQQPGLDHLPSQWRLLVGRCLTKDVRRRLQSIGEARLLLEDGLPETAALQANVRKDGARAWMAAASLMVLVAAFGWWMVWRVSRPADNPLVRLSVDLGPGALKGPFITSAISPDGARIAFLAQGANGRPQLAIRLLNQSQVTLLPGTDDASSPFFKPDGQWIGFFAGRKLKKISVDGGTAITLCNAPDARGATWSESGGIIAALNSGALTGLSWIPEVGGLPREITHPEATGEATHRWPQMLPGDQDVLFMSSRTASNYDEASIRVLSLKTGKIKLVQPGGYYGRYLPAGYLVYVHLGSLYGVHFNLPNMEVSGTPKRLLDDVAGNPQTAGGQFDFSRNGTFVYLSGAAPELAALNWLDTAGKTQPLLASAGYYRHIRLSPDGKKLAYDDNSDLKVYNIERDTTTQLTFPTPNHTDLIPFWTPDGKHLVFQGAGTVGFSLQWIRADGSGETQTLLETKTEVFPTSFSPDGARLVYFQRTLSGKSDIWTLPLDLTDPERPKPGKPEIVLQTLFSEQSPALSPDGHWMAYTSNESGQMEVFVRPFPVRPGKWLVAAGESPVRWSRDGRSLLYTEGGQTVMAVDVDQTSNSDSFSYSKPRQWSRWRGAGDWDLAPDGKRLANGGVRSSAGGVGGLEGSVHVTFLLNFFDEVRRRIPIRK